MTQMLDIGVMMMNVRDRFNEQQSTKWIKTNHQRMMEIMMIIVIYFYDSRERFVCVI